MKSFFEFCECLQFPFHIYMKNLKLKNRKLTPIMCCQMKVWQEKLLRCRVIETSAKRKEKKSNTNELLKKKFLSFSGVKIENPLPQTLKNGFARSRLTAVRYLRVIHIHGDVMASPKRNKKKRNRCHFPPDAQLLCSFWRSGVVGRKMTSFEERR